jgi:hypothetical protein
MNITTDLIIIECEKGTSRFKYSWPALFSLERTVSRTVYEQSSSRSGSLSRRSIVFARTLIYVRLTVLRPIWPFTNDDCTETDIRVFDTIVPSVPTVTCAARFSFTSILIFLKHGCQLSGFWEICRLFI